jgi:hypothetical protein
MRSAEVPTLERETEAGLSHRYSAAESDIHVPPTEGSAYWRRLARAAALVLFGIAVHTWIDTRPRHHQAGVLTASVASTQPPIAMIGSAGESIAAATRDLREPGPAVGEHPLVGTSGHEQGDSRNEGSDPVDRAERPGSPAFPRTATHASSAAYDDALPALSDGSIAPATPASLPVQWRSEVPVVAPLHNPEPEAADASMEKDGRIALLPTAGLVPVSTDTALTVVADRDEESIREVLREYEQAVGRKDSMAAKAVWPSLDERALARAFNDLQSHSLTLEDCGVTVAESAARARCQGVATYLPKVGRRKAISASHEWTFSLTKMGADWRIASAAIR